MGNLPCCLFNVRAGPASIGKQEIDHRLDSTRRHVLCQRARHTRAVGAVARVRRRDETCTRTDTGGHAECAAAGQRDRLASHNHIRTFTEDDRAGWRS